MDDRGVAPPADIVCCLDILRCLNASTREFAELSQRPNRCQLQAIGFIWRAREAALVFGGVTMHISNESLLVILFVGLVAGWLAGQIVRGAGFGLIGDLVIGIIGAFIGDWLLPQVGIHLGTGIVFRDRQRRHWRRVASACGWASARPPWRRLGRRLGQTPMVVVTTNVVGQFHRSSIRSPRCMGRPFSMQ